MRKSTHETWGFTFRKKIRSISALATKVGDTIWVPQVGRRFVLQQAFVYIPTEDDDGKTNGIVGTVTTEPNIQLTNGTVEAAASVDLPILNDSLLSLEVDRNVLFDHDHPLTLVQAVAQVGATRFNYDLILVGIKITL